MWGTEVDISKEGAFSKTLITSGNITQIGEYNYILMTGAGVITLPDLTLSEDCEKILTIKKDETLSFNDAVSISVDNTNGTSLNVADVSQFNKTLITGESVEIYYNCENNSYDLIKDYIPSAINIEAIINFINNGVDDLTLDYSFSKRDTDAGTFITTSDSVKSTYTVQGGNYNSVTIEGLAGATLSAADLLLLESVGIHNPTVATYSNIQNFQKNTLNDYDGNLAFPIKVQMRISKNASGVYSEYDETVIPTFKSDAYYNSPRYPIYDGISNKLFIADTGNSAIRSLDFDTKDVKTIMIDNSADSIRYIGLDSFTQNGHSTVIGSDFKFGTSSPSGSVYWLNRNTNNDLSTEINNWNNDINKDGITPSSVNLHWSSFILKDEATICNGKHVYWIFKSSRTSNQNNIEQYHYDGTNWVSVDFSSLYIFKGQNSLYINCARVDKYGNIIFMCAGGGTSGNETTSYLVKLSKSVSYGAEEEDPYTPSKWVTEVILGGISDRNTSTSPYVSARPQYATGSGESARYGKAINFEFGKDYADGDYDIIIPSYASTGTTNTHTGLTFVKIKAISGNYEGEIKDNTTYIKSVGLQEGFYPNISTPLLFGMAKNTKNGKYYIATIGSTIWEFDSITEEMKVISGVSNVSGFQDTLIQ